jgi:hypothetical protein
MDRLSGSSRPILWQISRTTKNTDAVNNLVPSQEGAPQAHKITRQVARETDLSRRQ